MGMESYLVRLTGKSAGLRPVVEFAERELGLVPDFGQHSHSGNELFFALRDGRHVIEFEIAHCESVFEISVRFALCNPPSVDEVFIRLITQLLERFDSTATVSDEPSEGTAKVFSRKTKDLFALEIHKSINRSRGYWRGMFGLEEAAVPVSEALRRFVLPHCEPVHS
jgi:hypothetical protein